MRGYFLGAALAVFLVLGHNGGKPVSRSSIQLCPAGPARGRRRGVGDLTKVQIDSERCQGHGRCYDLAPGLFGEDDEGFGTVLGDGVVSSDNVHEARLAVSNCPERAISITEEG